MFDKSIHRLPAVPSVAYDQGGIYLNAIRFVMSSNRVNAETAASVVLKEMDGYASDLLVEEVRKKASQVNRFHTNGTFIWSMAWTY